MRNFWMVILAGLSLAAFIHAIEKRVDLNGTWIFDPAQSDSGGQSRQSRRVGGSMGGRGGFPGGISPGIGYPGGRRAGGYPGGGNGNDGGGTDEGIPRGRMQNLTLSIVQTENEIQTTRKFTVNGKEQTIAQKFDLDGSQDSNQARAALGGAAALNAVKSLSAFGDFRNGSGGKEASGEVQLDLMLPDKLMRIMKWNQIQEMKVTSVEVMNGSQVWTDSQMKDLSPMAGGGPIGGGGMGRGGSRGGGGMGRGGGRRSAGGSSGEGSTKGPLPDYVDIADNQQILSDFSCLMLALLLHFPDSSQLEISSEGDVDIDGAKADSLKITAGNRSVMSLAMDQKTHRPMMAAYNASTADQAGAEEKQTDSLKPEMTQIQIFFSDYKAIAEKGSGDIWFPHQITKTRDGLTVEDMRIKKLQLNPHINPKQFEKKKWNGSYEI